MENIVCLCVFVLVGILRFGECVQTYYMAQHCRQTIPLVSLDANQIQLKLYDGLYPLELELCDVTIKAPEGNRLMLYFESIALNNDHDCRHASVSLYDGNWEWSSYVPGFYGPQCGYSGKNRGVHTTSTEDLHIIFRTDKPMITSDFNLIITSFHTGRCYPNEYSCSNDRCVDKHLSCNGYNPCGDNSDCSLSSGTVAVIVIGCIIGGIILVVIIVSAIVIWMRRRYTYFPLPNTNEASTVTSSSPTSYGTVDPPPPYSPPVYPSAPQQQSTENEKC